MLLHFEGLCRHILITFNLHVLISTLVHYISYLRILTLMHRYFFNLQTNKNKPEDHWSCKRSPDTWTKEVSAFPLQMPKEPKLIWCLNRSRSSQGHNLYKLCSTTVPYATYHLSRQLTKWF